MIPMVMGLIAAGGLFGVGMLVGMAVATRQYDRRLKLAANPEQRGAMFRSAMFVDGDFYYVVPEREYNELTIRPPITARVVSGETSGITTTHNGTGYP